jgi:hypothetical protein
MNLVLGVGNVGLCNPASGDGFLQLASSPRERLMAWWYELRGADKRLVEMRRGFGTENEAQQAAERAKQMIQYISRPRNTEDLTVVTGTDEKSKSKIAD